MKSRTWLCRFLHNREGSVLIITGLTFLVLMAVGGAAIDLGRQQLVRAKLQQATDAATVAAAALPDSATDGERTVAANRYFALNFPDGYLGVQRPAPAVSLSGGNISVTANVGIETRFIKLIGISDVDSMGRTVMNRNTVTTSSKYDLVLVMDISGSMGAADAGNGLTRIQAQRNAANQIATNLLNPNTTDSRIAAVTWHDSVGSNIGFQSTFAPIQTFNNAMTPRSGTNSTAGLEYARTNFVSQFRSDAVKAVVLITDGGNGANVPPYSTYAINRASLQECDSLKSQGTVVYTIAFGETINGACYSYQCPAGMCNNFGVPSNPNDPNLCARPFLQACATTPGNFFAAPDQVALNQAFAAILTSIQNMRIVE